MDNNWTDPRYTELVEAWSHLQRRARSGVVKPCPSCVHGLGSIVMVDLATKEPITPVPCPRCATEA